MIQSMLLSNKEFNSDGFNHGDFHRFLRQYKSVVDSELLDTTSTGGDWSGFIQQKLNGTYYIITFFQYHANGGWNAPLVCETGSILASGKEKFTREDVYSIWNETLE